MRHKNKIIFASTLILFCLSSSYLASSKIRCSRSTEPLANLILKTDSGKHFDYAISIAEYLRQIGIKTRIKVEEWGHFDDLLIPSRNYDMAIIEISQQSVYTSNLRTIFTENGSLNIFGLNNDFPYVEQSEQMLKEVYSTNDYEKSDETLFNWMRLLMDKILPAFPLYISRRYWVEWSNIQNTDGRWGLSNSLPYIYFEELHEGQNSMKELNLYDSYKGNFNPLRDKRLNHYWIVNQEENRYPDNLKLSLITEPIQVWSPDKAPLKTGLVEDWEQISNDHFKYYMRDNVYWNPSYNITVRNEYSYPLNITDTSDLMNGLKYGEYSNGTNQLVSAKDVVFTLLTYANPLVSELYGSFSWIEDIMVDNNDTLAFHIFKNKEIRYPILNYPILPEFFLNSTNTSLSYSSGGVKTWGIYNGIESTPQWESYWSSAFGCGKYMADYYKENGFISFEKSPYWYGVGAIDGSINLDLNIERINIHSNLKQENILGKFLKGKIDILSINHDYRTIKEIETDPRFLVQRYDPDFMTYLVFNLERPFIGHADNYEFLCEHGKEEYTKGVGVRKAISYAIDRKKMRLELNNGEVFITDHPIFFFPFICFDTWEECYIYQYNHSIDEAFEWLDAAGWAAFICNKVTSFNFFYTLIVFIIAGSSIFKKRRKRISA